MSGFAASSKSEKMKLNQCSASHRRVSLIRTRPAKRCTLFGMGKQKHLKSCNGGSETAGDPYVYLCDGDGNGALEALVTLLDMCLAIQV